MFYIIFFVLAVLFIFLIFINKYKELQNKNNINLDKLAKILVVILLVLSFIDIFLPDAFSLRYIFDFNYLKEHHDPFHAIIRAFNAMAVITLPFAIFYKKGSFIKVSSFILLPMILVNICYYDQYIAYFTGELTTHATVFGEKLYPFLTNEVFRSIMFGIIMMLELVLAVYVLFNNYKALKFNGIKDVINFFGLTIGLLLSNMPIYTIQQITGSVSNITFNFGDPMHFIYIGLVAVEGIILSLLFKKKDKEDKYILLLVMSISLLFQYNTFFKTDGVITATRYPLQLCNIAGAFLIVTLLTKSEKMFHFTVVVNVTGAIIAMALCDSTKDVGVLYCMNIHYMVEHTNVLLVPLLGLILGVFKPLKVKDIKDFILGFTGYYLGVFLIGTILNGIYYKTDNSYFKCNYLFMFDKGAAERLVGNFVGKLFDLKITLFNYYHIYLAQLAVYIVFLLVCSLIFMILYLIFKERKVKYASEAK